MNFASRPFTEQQAVFVQAGVDVCTALVAELVGKARKSPASQRASYVKVARIVLEAVRAELRVLERQLDEIGR